MPISELNFRLFNFPKDTDGFFEQSFARTWSGGGVLGVISLTSDEGAVVKVGELLVHSLQDLIMNSVEENRIKLIEQAVEQLHNQAVNLLAAESIEKANLDFGIALFVEGVLYVGILGEISCFVQKADKIVNLSQYSSDEIFVVSGKLDPQDLVFLCRKDVLSSCENILENLISIVDYAGVVASYDSEINFEGGDIIPKLVEEEIDDVNFAGEEDSVEAKREVLDNARTGTENDKESIDEVLDEDSGLLPGLEDEYKVDKEIRKEAGAMSFVSGKFIPLAGKIQNVVGGVVLKGMKKLGIYLGRGANWILNTILGKGDGRYSTSASNNLKRRRIILIVIIIGLIAILYVSTTKINDSNARKENEETYLSLFSQAEGKVQDAESQAQYNVDETRSLLATAYNLIDEAEVIDVEIPKDFAGLRERVLVVEDLLEQRVRISDPDIVSSLRIRFEKAEPVDMVLVDNYLWLTDPVNSAIYRVSADGGEPEQIFSRTDGIEEPRYLESMDGVIYVYDNKAGVMSIKFIDEVPTIASVTGLTSTSLGDVTEMASYSGALYFLVASENKIVKAMPMGSGFAYPQDRFVDEVLNGADDLEINGLMFTFGDAKVNRIFPEGLDYQLELTGLEVPMGDTTKFDVFAFDKIAVLDSGNRRIVEFSQPSQGISSVFKFVKQYVVSVEGDKYFNDLREIEYDIVTGNAYVLDGFYIIRIKEDE